MENNERVEVKEEVALTHDSTIIVEEVAEAKEVIRQVEALEGAAIGCNPFLPGVIRVYQDSIPWQNRNNATILALGKVLGVDYFIHPLTDLAMGIPEDTRVVLISSNSAGSKVAANEETLPIAQRNLDSFVQCGGVLVVDMADNLEDGGYFAPGSYGTPTRIFPDNAVAYKLFLTEESRCTAFVNGPTITLTDCNISMDPNTRYSAHGNLEDGISVPPCAQKLMTAIFGGVAKTVLASYPLGAGYVIVDTVTKEFYGQNPEGNGPSNIITNLIYYAYYLAGEQC